MRHPHNRGCRSLVLFAAFLCVLVTALLMLVAHAYADHGTMPRAHWESGHRFGIAVLNRANSSVVLQAAWDWNQTAPDLVTFGNYAEGGNPDDCSPVEWSVVLCRSSPNGNPTALVGGNTHLAWCVVYTSWGQNDLAAITHELGHCLGLGEHGSPGGIMGGEGRITEVDRAALRQVYSHSDTAPPPAPPTSSAPPAPPPPGPSAADGRPTYTPPPERNCLRLFVVLCF